jgi:uncharacterized lipoprotein NlpE involved in copper resistance
MSFKIFYPASRCLAGLCFLLVIVMAGCASQPKVKDNPWKAQGVDTTPTPLGTFQGILPCADCPGIDTRLTLVQYGPNIAEGTYSLQQTYEDRNVKPLVTAGDWTTLRGDAADPDAVVYQLDPDHPEHSLYFLKTDENKLEQLDSNLKEMPSNLNFILTKKDAGQTQN